MASYLSDHVMPLLIGRDARRIEDMWQYLYKGAYWRRGPVTMTAIAAVDTALWDILGKTLNAPVYQLLGGASRESVMVYGHANGSTRGRDGRRRCSDYIALGYRAVRAQCAIPGVVNAYGVGRGTLYYEPAQKGMPLESVWSTERYLDFVPPLFERLRREVGFDVHLLHDVHHRLTPIEAARLGKSLEPYRLFWLEDPVPAENQAAFRTIRQHTTTPIAVGEVFNTIYDCQQLIEEELIDYIRMTVVHGGGISHLRKIAALAELHHVRTGSHGATDLSPVAMAAALHFDLSVHNFGIQEYMRHTPETDAVFPHAYTFESGAMHPGDAPGLGVDIDEALAAKLSVRPGVSAGQPQTGWDGALMVTRREFLTGSRSAAYVRRVRLRAGPAMRAQPDAADALPIRYGYAAITWGSATSSRRWTTSPRSASAAIQLRGEAFAQFGDKPKALRELLDEHRLTFAVLSSGNLSIDPAREQEMLATAHAATRSSCATPADSTCR